MKNTERSAGFHGSDSTECCKHFPCWHDIVTQLLQMCWLLPWWELLVPKVLEGTEVCWLWRTQWTHVKESVSLPEAVRRWCLRLRWSRFWAVPRFDSVVSRAWKEGSGTSFGSWRYFASHPKGLKTTGAVPRIKPGVKQGLRGSCGQLARS